MLKTSVALLLATSSLLLLPACTDADMASANLSKAADNFEVNRRVVFYNGITGGYMLTIEGLCSLGNQDKPRQITITCKTSADSYKKHFLGLSDNVTYFVEQQDALQVGVYNYRVTFKPEAILPYVDLRTSIGK